MLNARLDLIQFQERKGYEGNVINTLPVTSSLRDFTLPVKTTHKSVIVNRFSAPGDRYTMSRGFLNPSGEELSAYNALPFRNEYVRNANNEKLSRHMSSLGYEVTGGLTTPVPSEHRVNRNPARVIGSIGTYPYGKWDLWSPDYNNFTHYNMGAVGTWWYDADLGSEVYLPLRYFGKYGGNDSNSDISPAALKTSAGSTTALPHRRMVIDHQFTGTTRIKSDYIGYRNRPEIDGSNSEILFVLVSKDNTNWRAVYRIAAANDNRALSSWHPYIDLYLPSHGNYPSSDVVKQDLEIIVNPKLQIINNVATIAVNFVKKLPADLENIKLS